jgi:hypothetical protein
LNSFRQGDITGGDHWLQLATATANSAPILTLLTITGLFGIVGYILYIHHKKAKLKHPIPSVPQPLP